MNKHVQQIAEQNRITILYDKDVKSLFPPAEAKFLMDFGSCALRNLRSVYLKPEGRPRRDYMVAMHEIGHILNPIRGWKRSFNYKRRLKDEQKAWEWALSHARPRVTDSDLQVLFESYLCHTLHPELDEAMELMRRAAVVRQKLDTLSQFPDVEYRLWETVTLEIEMAELQDRWEELIEEQMV